MKFPSMEGNEFALLTANLAYPTPKPTPKPTQ